MKQPHMQPGMQPHMFRIMDVVQKITSIYKKNVGLHKESARM